MTRSRKKLHVDSAQGHQTPSPEKVAASAEGDQNKACYIIQLASPLICIMVQNIFSVLHHYHDDDNSDLPQSCSHSILEEHHTFQKLHLKNKTENSVFAQMPPHFHDKVGGKKTNKISSKQKKWHAKSVFKA